MAAYSTKMVVCRYAEHMTWLKRIYSESYERAVIRYGVALGLTFREGLQILADLELQH